MKYPIHVLPAAARDVDETARFIAKDNVDAALRFYDAVEQSFGHIREDPQRSPVYQLAHPRLTDIRKRSVRGFNNYLIFYRFSRGIVEIIRVLHGARDIPALLDDELGE
jgi:toxin ParE1/3/4